MELKIKLKQLRTKYNTVWKYSKLEIKFFKGTIEDLFEVDSLFSDYSAKKSTGKDFTENCGFKESPNHYFDHTCWEL